jgi:hypothetical protein
MKTHTSETKEAGFYAYAAMRDARMRNEAMKSHYSAAERLRAERMRLGLECVYRVTEVHINYRQKFIAVKLTNALVRDRASVADLEAVYALEGISKEITPQAIIYRIPRTVQ